MKNRIKYLVSAALIVVSMVAACGPVASQTADQPTTATPADQPTEPPAEVPTKVPTPTPQPFYQEYGVHIHPTWDLEYDMEQIAQAADLGATWIRIGVSWRLQEPLPGKWDEGWYLLALDELVKYVASKGLNVLLMLAETPCWASSDPNKDCGRVESYNKWYPTYDPRLYAIALGFLVDRYGDQIYAWEVWNEPNMSNFWGGSSNDVEDNAADYVAMLEAAHRQVKGIDPDAIVLGGSLAGADVEYLEAMYAGAKDFFDALALHPYSGTQPPDGCDDPRWSYQCGVEAIREAMLGHGDESQIWFTEIGWPSFEGYQGVGEKQAEYLTQAFEIAKEWDYVPTIIWYDLVDDSETHPDNREGYFGLLDPDLEPKPAAEAFRKTVLSKVSK